MIMGKFYLQLLQMLAFGKSFQLLAVDPVGSRPGVVLEKQLLAKEPACLVDGPAPHIPAMPSISIH